MIDVAAIAVFSDVQDGLVTTGQLRQIGVDRSCQSRLAARGVLTRVHRGVWRLVGAPTTWKQQVRAATLVGGSPRPAASHRSALRLNGLRSDSAVEVSIAYPAIRQIDGVVVHRSIDLVDADLVEIDGIRATSVARALVDAGLIFPQHEIQRLVDHAVATDLTTKSALIEVRRRVGEHGRNGVGKLDLAIAGLPEEADGMESGPEVALLRILKRAGLPAPLPQFKITIGGTSRRIDLAYPKAKLALEYDGKDVHTRVEQFEDDRRRQNSLVLLGWSVLRYTNGDLRDRPGSVIAQVRRFLDL